jgi:hypothetical protein
MLITISSNYIPAIAQNLQETEMVPTSYTEGEQFLKQEQKLFEKFVKDYQNP